MLYYFGVIWNEWMFKKYGVAFWSLNTRLFLPFAQLGHFHSLPGFELPTLFSKCNLIMWVYTLKCLYSSNLTLMYFFWHFFELTHTFLVHNS